ncbi:MAG: class I SAM-dependent methyltransferase, partial [Chitinophagaceae bacterium]|nr:class I SAM-dependent methyltransferase [Chitinophagaceae bacterium]
MMKTYLKLVCAGLIITNLWSAVVFGQEKPATLDAAVEEKSIREGINDRFKAADLTVEEFLKTFEVESREVYSKRNEILEHINVRPGQNVIDLGAGTGFYTFLFAEAVGSEGKVLALDIAPAFVKSINEKAESKKLKNVKALVSSDINFEADKEAYDLVFLCDVYHHIEYPQRINRRIVES